MARPSCSGWFASALLDAFQIASPALRSSSRSSLLRRSVARGGLRRASQRKWSHSLVEDRHTSQDLSAFPRQITYTPAPLHVKRDSKFTGSLSESTPIPRSTQRQPQEASGLSERNESSTTLRNSQDKKEQTPINMPKPRRFTLSPKKATITLSSTAVTHLRDLLDQPEPKLIRIGTKAKGCSGLAYHLEYVDKPSKLDETVEQDGVKVLIDNKALINIIGSEMDWLEDKLSSRFIFKNPNITEQCGCGESFSVR